MANQSWKSPSKRASQYAKELKQRKHLNAKHPKNGKALTKAEGALRMGYLQAQKDSAEMYKFKKRKQK